MSNRNVTQASYAGGLVVTGAGFPPGHSVLSQTFSAVGASVAVPTPAGTASGTVLVAVATGAPTTATVVLEGSYDQSTWVQLPQPGYNTALQQPYPYVRLRCTALSGGTTPTVTGVAISNP